jgi:membrane protease YdiL (CAAX protease family)
MASDYYRVTDLETRLRSVSHSVGLVVAAFLVALALQYVTIFSLAGTGLVSMEALVNSDITIPPLPYALLTTSQFVGFFVAVFGYLRWRDDADLFRLAVPSLRGLGWIVGGFVLLYGLNLGVTVVFSALDVEIATNQVVQDGNQDPVRFLYMIPVTLLFVAPAEELLFRGTVQGLFRRAYGVVPGVLLASFLFGFGHWLALVGTGGGKLAYVVVAALLGLVLGTLYELTENLTIPIAAHGLYNTLLFVGQYFVATGAIQA